MTYYRFPILKLVEVELEKGFFQSGNPDEDLKYENEGGAW
jgi:hypothetical protein